MTDSVPVSDANWAGQESEDTGSKAQEQTKSSSNVTSFPTFLYRCPLQENKNVEKMLKTTETHKSSSEDAQDNRTQTLAQKCDCIRLWHNAILSVHISSTFFLLYISIF